MRKMFFILVLLPFAAFCDIKVRVKYFTGVSTNTAFSSSNTFDDPSRVASCYYNSTFGYYCSSSDFSLVSPSLSSSSGNRGLLNNQVATNGNSYVLSPLLFPGVKEIFFGVEYLLNSGYQGPAVSLVSVSPSNYRCFNVNFPLLVSDVLSSTNTVFRRSLLASLTAIENAMTSFVQSSSLLSSSISSVSDSVDSFSSSYNLVNSSILDFTNFVNSASARGEISDTQAQIWLSDYSLTFTNPEDYGTPADYARSVFNQLYFKNQLDYILHRFNSDTTLLDPFANSFGRSFMQGASPSLQSSIVDPLSANFSAALRSTSSPAYNDFTNYVARTAEAGAITQQRAQQLINDYNNASDKNSYASSVAPSLDQANAAIEQLNSLTETQKGRDLISELAGNFSQAGAYHYTTPLTNEMQKIEKKVAAIKDDTGNVVDNVQDLKDNSDDVKRVVENAYDAAQNAIRVWLPENVFSEFSVAISGPVNLQPNIEDAIENTSLSVDAVLSEFKKWAWDDPKSWAKFFVDQYAPDVSSNVVRAASLVEALTNILFSATTDSNGVANLSFSVDSMLLSDYENFITSSTFDSCVSLFSTNVFGDSDIGTNDLSTVGRWWVMQALTMAQQSRLNDVYLSAFDAFGSAFDDADISPDGTTDGQSDSLTSSWFTMISNFPDPEELQQLLDEGTNMVANVGFDQIDELFDSATNDFDQVVSGVFVDRSLPTSIQLVLIPSSKQSDGLTVNIPVAEHSSLWSLFRQGMAFALSVITLLLFPKYVNWLFSRYTHLVEKIIKSLHAYAHS